MSGVLSQSRNSASCVIEADTEAQLQEIAQQAEEMAMMTMSGSLTRHAGGKGMPLFEPGDPDEEAEEVEEHHRRRVDASEEFNFMTAAEAAEEEMEAQTRERLAGEAARSLHAMFGGAGPLAAQQVQRQEVAANGNRPEHVRRQVGYQVPYRQSIAQPPSGSFGVGGRIGPPLEGGLEERYEQLRVGVEARGRFQPPRAAGFGRAMQR